MAIFLVYMHVICVCDVTVYVHTDMCGVEDVRGGRLGPHGDRHRGTGLTLSLGIPFLSTGTGATRTERVGV